MSVETVAKSTRRVIAQGEVFVNECDPVAAQQKSLTLKDLLGFMGEARDLGAPWNTPIKGRLWPTCYLEVEW